MDTENETSKNEFNATSHKTDVSRSFSTVVIKNEETVIKTLKDTSIIPRTNNLLYVDGKRYQVTSNFFNYDDGTIYIWVSRSF